MQQCCERLPADAYASVTNIEIDGPLQLEGLSLGGLSLENCGFEASLDLRGLEIAGTLRIADVRLEPMKHRIPGLDPLPEDTTYIDLIDCRCQRLEVKNCRVGWLLIRRVQVADHCELKKLALLYGGLGDTISDCVFGRLDIRETSARHFGVESSRCGTFVTEPDRIETLELKNFEVEQHATIEGGGLQRMIWRNGEVKEWLRVCPGKIDNLELALKVQGYLTCESASIVALRIEGVEVQGKLALRADRIGHMLLDKVVAKELWIFPKGRGALELSGSAVLSNVTLEVLTIGYVALGNLMRLTRVSVAGKAVFDRWEVPNQMQMPNQQLPGLLQLDRCEADELTFSTSDFEGLGGPERCALLDCNAGTIRWYWRQQIIADLRGTTYGKLLFSSDEESMRGSARKSIDFLRHARPMPQAYLTLATSYTALGYQDDADYVRYELRCLDIEYALRDGNWLRAALLWILKRTMGFGIGMRAFRCLGVLVLFIVLGAVVIQCMGPSSGKYDWPWALGASLHRLLPVVNLSPRYVEFFRDLPGDNTLNYLQNAYFCLHSMVGWLLGSFLIAALAGLTQKRH